MIDGRIAYEEVSPNPKFLETGTPFDEAEDRVMDGDEMQVLEAGRQLSGGLIGVPSTVLVRLLELEAGEIEVLESAELADRVDQVLVDREELVWGSFGDEFQVPRVTQEFDRAELVFE
jgi:hypothetical protein